MRGLMRRLRGERGTASVVEAMLLVLPALTLVAGFAAFATEGQAFLAAQNAANVAAQTVERDGALPGAMASEISAALATAGITNVQIVAPTAALPPGTEFYVTVTGGYSSPVALFSTDMPQAISVTATGEVLAGAP